MGKEHIEIFCDGTAIAVDDYRRLTVRVSRRIDAKSQRPDKGHGAELQHFADAIRGLVAPVMTHQDGVRAAVCCLKLIESTRVGSSAGIDLREWSSVTRLAAESKDTRWRSRAGRVSEPSTSWKKHCRVNSRRESLGADDQSLPLGTGLEQHRDGPIAFLGSVRR